VCHHIWLLFLRRTCHTGLGISYMITFNLIYLFKGLIFKYSNMLSSTVIRTSTYEFCRDISQFISLGEIFFFCLFFFGAGIEPRASHMLGKHCTTKLHPSPVHFTCCHRYGIVQRLCFYFYIAVISIDRPQLF
jgi:hypothetical protein